LVKKRKIVKHQYEPSRRQLSHAQQQRRRRRFILGIGSVIVAAVLILVGVGVYSQWYLPVYKPLHQTVLEVNGTSFKMDYFIKALNHYSGGQMDFISFLIDPVVDNIQKGELIKQEALSLDYSVSDKEIRDTLEESSIADNKATRDIVETQLIISKLTDEYFDPQVPQVMLQKDILVMFLESQSKVEEVRQRLTDGEDFGELAAEFSLDETTGADGGELGWRPDGIIESVLNAEVIEDFISSAAAGELSPPILDEDKSKAIGYWLVNIIEKHDEPEEVHIQVMLLSSEEEALEVTSRLDAGEDFGELAAELSQLTGAADDKGDLGFITREVGQSAFNEFVFDSGAGPSSLSQPIADENQPTQSGYWLVEVRGVENDRPLSEENRDLLLNNAFQDWLEAITDDPANQVTNYLNDEMRAFAIANAG
jgi:parvulin-like peptidyl-prolyl isomerase